MERLRSNGRMWFVLGTYDGGSSARKDERRINRVLSTNVVVGKSRFICQFDHHYTSVPAVSSQ
ncbi:hypothetical protein T07_6188 [Trichinella nelsoni]|uniref:Uncharacterized protein n=1 Tax=Trichinella nelsoni TaxID=6336 RepID=A0A0V0RP48_9BILA|nr:hypothetical protein T07_6188 [Trichinella nelsoni]